MCGITGLYNLTGKPADAATLRRMTDAIGHRGPDGEGFYLDGAVALGHRRLAIIDLSAAGQQPMSNAAGDIVVSYNGEIYNFRELRVELQALGYHFFSKTDTEVLLYAYEAWGERAVERLNGMFAFAIYDRRGLADGQPGKLFLARDRFGVKPLYYFLNDDSFLFGSEIKALLQHPMLRARVCYAALSEYFTFQNIFSDRTLFEGVRLLPPGTTLMVDSSSDQKVRCRHYWDYHFSSQNFDLSPEQASDRLYELFEQAVTRQLIADVPVGAYLSGGMDSGSITAVAARMIPRLHTFTGGFDLSSATGVELGYDERPASEALSHAFRTEHYESVMHAGDMEHVLPELIWHLEDLRMGQSYPNYYAAGLASKFVTVVLAGTGGDELFGGYPWRYAGGLTSADGDGFDQSVYKYWQRLVPDDHRPIFYNPATYAEVRQVDPRDVFQAIFAPTALDSVEDAVNASLYFEAKTFLHGLFVVEDKLSMAHSLETRVPFMDNDLVDFAMSIPPSYKLRDLGRIPTTTRDSAANGTPYRPTANGKMILRQSMNRLLPDGVTSRAKQGFSAPDASWFRGESSGYVDALLCSPESRIADYVSPDYVRQRLDEHISGHVNHRLLIWSLLSFEWWLRKFIA